MDSKLVSLGSSKNFGEARVTKILSKWEEMKYIYFLEREEFIQKSSAEHLEPLDKGRL